MPVVAPTRSLSYPLFRPDAAMKNIVKLMYDAIRPKGTRRPIYISSRSEDRELTRADRTALVSAARDLLRNAPVASAALRRHLQYVANYRFRASTSDRDFNDALERRVALWTRRENCDAAGRSGFGELMRVVEACRVLDGDVGLVKRADCKLQVVEGDRIRNPRDVGEASDEWIHGIKVDLDGRAVAYSIWARGSGGVMIPEKEIDAADFCLIAYRVRRDQARGVSPFAPVVGAISQLNDCYEYALAKMKLEQQVGLVSKTSTGRLAGFNDRGDDSAANEEAEKRAKAFFGDDTLYLALGTEDSVEFVSSNTPSQNFQTFTQAITRQIYMALDLPYSFYDGSQLTFAGNKGEYEQYLDAVSIKQEPVLETLDSMFFDWLLPNWLSDPSDPIHSFWRAGLTSDDLRGRVGWRGAGLPKWRLCERVKETILAIDAGLMNPYVCADEYGESVAQNLADLKNLVADAKEKGLELPYAKTDAVNAGL